MGLLVDRLGVRRALGIGIIVVLASLVLRGLATNFITLFLAMALFGIGGPIISIGAPKMVAQWFSGKEALEIVGWNFGGHPWAVSQRHRVRAALPKSPQGGYWM